MPALAARLSAKGRQELERASWCHRSKCTRIEPGDSPNHWNQERAACEAGICCGPVRNCFYSRYARPVQSDDFAVNTVADSRSGAGPVCRYYGKAGVHFLHQAPRTSRKYLIETMGSGVALFDCDNDGRLDLYLINGAFYSDPEPKGSIPQKSGAEYWNRMYRQNRMALLKTSRKSPVLKGSVTAWE